MLKKRSASLNTQTLLDFDLEESSSDSDFRIEDHNDDDGSDDFNSDDDPDKDSDGDDDSGSDEDSDSDDSKKAKKKAGLGNGGCSMKSPSRNFNDPLKKLDPKLLQSLAPICLACLGDRSDDMNEIVECDNCGVTVHEGCYGVSESASVSSTVSSCSTEPWFCEVCKADVQEPSCELCPNKGGIFKETDVGKWVHLICALYVPGVAFGEVDQLASVTLFEMPYNKWGAKTCSICDDARFARSGVCIGCDAGMCKTYFHVTCAQSMGLLSEPHSEEADHADPFYAHCKVHSDKTMVKHRKRNYNALQVRLQQKKLEHDQKRLEEASAEQQRVERKLKKHKKKYLANKAIKIEPWVPTQKMPRLITTSASAVRKLLHKANLMGIDSEALEVQEAQMSALSDVRKKWHIPPAFSVEFIGYFLDRITRLRDIKANLEIQVASNGKLLGEQQHLKDKYDQMIRDNEELARESEALKEKIQVLHSNILSLGANKPLPPICAIGKASPAIHGISVPSPAPTPPARPMSVPTAAALKMGVGFPLQNPSTNNAGKILSTQRPDKNELLHECGICKRCTDQHLLAKCDTCHFHYHLGCLNPPLTRHPKKGKLYGWQCSECDKSDGSDTGVAMPEGPRKSRTRYSKDGIIVPANSAPESPIKVEIKEEANKSVNGGKEEPECIPDTVSPTVPVVAVAPMIIPKVKITPTRGRGRGRGRGRASSTTSSRKSIDSVTTDPSGSGNVSAAQSPTSLPVSIPVTWPTPLSPAQRPTSTAPLPPPLPLPPVVVELPGSASTPKASKSEKKRAKKEKKHNKQLAQQQKKPVYYIQNAVAGNPISSNNLSDGHGDDEAEDEEEDEVPETNESLVDKHLLNLSHDLAQSNATVDSTLNTTNDLLATDEDKASHHRKKKNKEKHKNKNHDSERSSKSPSAKEHKRKRKRKYDMENTTEEIADLDGASHPRIKIKFKAIPIPGGAVEGSAEKQFMYVPAAPDEPGQMPSPKRMKSPYKMKSPDGMRSPMKISESPISERRSLASPATTPKRSSATPTNSSTPTPGRKRKLDSTTPTSERIQNCDVCHQEGNAQNLVKCDECKKNYHFTCLDPPLKKTPKKRGYSWHCADCDPTDKENN